MTDIRDLLEEARGHSILTFIVLSGVPDLGGSAEHTVRNGSGKMAEGAYL